MTTIECDNCGHVFDVEENTQCPKCNHPLVRFTVTLKKNGQVVIDRLAVLPDGGYKKMRQNTPYKPIFKTIDFERDAIMKVTYIVHNTNKYDKEHPYPDMEMQK